MANLDRQETRVSVESQLVVEIGQPDPLVTNTIPENKVYSPERDVNTKLKTSEAIMCTNQLDWF